MAELIQTFAEVVRDAGGAEYTAHAYGEERDRQRAGRLSPVAVRGSRFIPLHASFFILP